MTDSDAPDFRDVTVVIPVFNEHELIEVALRKIRSTLGDLAPVLIIYDFAEDTTVPAVRRYQEVVPTHNVSLVLNTRGRGVVHAIIHGLRSVTTPLALVAMADLSDDIGMLPRMIAKARDGASVVCGSRYVKGGHHYGGPPLKRLLSRTAGMSFHWLTGAPTHDVSNSYKVYRTSFLESISIESNGGFEVGLEILTKAWLAGEPIAEVPVTWRDRTAGESNFHLKKWLPEYIKWYLHGARRNRLTDVIDDVVRASENGESPWRTSG
jgi:dolichol-phosphate mannosyltransferase